MFSSNKISPEEHILQHLPRNLDVSYFRYMRNNKVYIITNLDIYNSNVIPKYKIWGRRENISANVSGYTNDTNVSSANDTNDTNVSGQITLLNTTDLSLNEIEQTPDDIYSLGTEEFSDSHNIPIRSDTPLSENENISNENISNENKNTNSIENTNSIKREKTVKRYIYFSYILSFFCIFSILTTVLFIIFSRQTLTHNNNNSVYNNITANASMYIAEPNITFTFAPTASPSTLAPAPITLAPAVTLAPATLAPTAAPITIAPATLAPTPIVTYAPETAPPSVITPAPAPTAAPATLAPAVTLAPTPMVTYAPETAPPSVITLAPTVAPAATAAPGTLAPPAAPAATLAPNATAAPVTLAPTAAPAATLAPATLAPATLAPNATLAPTAAPATLAPTTSIISQIQAQMLQITEQINLINQLLQKIT
jgi:hypothetical protein